MSNLRSYKRRYNGRYRKRRKYRLSRFSFTAKGIAKRALAIARKNRMSKHSELKFVDNNWEATMGSMTAGGSAFFLNGIAQGVTSVTRIGDKVKLRQCNMRLQLKNLNADPIQVRVVLVADMQNQGAVADYDEIFEENHPMAYRTTTAVKRFKVIHNKTHHLDRTGSESGKDIVIVHVYSPVNVISNYTGATTGIADAGNGALVCYLMPNVDANMPSYLLKTRVRYHDES